MSVGSIVDGHGLVVCVGTGGVGKTTLAAAIALGGAARGRRAMVLTIDPARALARALGLRKLDRGGQRIDVGALGGSLDAAMLDQKSAWDGFIERLAPTSAVRDAILANPFYDELSRRFAGATEYVAVEELCRLHESGRYDLIVLDTPPAAHALDFVVAPEHIDRLLDPEIASWLSHPSVRAGRAAGRTLHFVVRQLERATGRKTLRDISAFFAAAGTVFDDVRQRARAARALLHAPGTAFVLITGPDAGVLTATGSLDARIRELQLPLRAVIANRMHPVAGALEADGPDALQRVLARVRADPPPHAWIDATCREAFARARGEEAGWQRLLASLPAHVEHAIVAELDRDVCSLDEIAAIGRGFWPVRQ